MTVCEGVVAYLAGAFIGCTAVCVGWLAIAWVIDRRR